LSVSPVTGDKEKLLPSWSKRLRTKDDEVGKEYSKEMKIPGMRLSMGSTRMTREAASRPMVFRYTMKWGQ
jgi:hypothetical protein